LHSSQTSHKSNQKAYKIIKKIKSFLLLHPMPQQLGNLLKKLILRAGLDAGDAKLAELLSINATVGDDTFNRLSDFLEGALSLDSAKNDSRLDAHFRQRALSPLDAEIKKITEEFGFDDELKSQFDSEKSTYKKTRLLAEKIKELEEKRSLSKNGDKATLEAEIIRLHAEMVKAKQAADARVKEMSEQANQQMLDYAIRSELGTKPYADSIPEAIRVSGAYNLLQHELNAKGIKVSRTDDNKLKLVKADNPDLNYMDNNKEVSFDEFATKLLAAHTMLKVSDPAGSGKGTTTPIIKQGKGKTLDASHIKSFNEAQIEQMRSKTGR
jgi:hypothetical protein